MGCGDQEVPILVAIIYVHTVLHFFHRYEITDVSPDKFISEAMDQQAAAERERRRKVLEAEGAKRAAELHSEGVKIRLKNESEGMLIQVSNEAEASKRKMLLEGEAEALVIRMRAQAQADAIKILAESLSSEVGREAAMIALAKEVC